MQQKNKNNNPVDLSYKVMHHNLKLDSLFSNLEVQTCILIKQKNFLYVIAIDLFYVDLLTDYILLRE